MLAELRHAALISLLRLPRPLMRWLAGKPARIEGQQLDPARVAVGGDSAGGNRVKTFRALLHA